MSSSEVESSDHRNSAFEVSHRATQEADSSPARGNPFPVVGIGASAGGLEAFSQLLAALPTDTGMAFVLVQHLDPEHDSLLTDLLGPLTRMPVVTVEDGVVVEPDQVYVIPPNTSMELEGRTLRLDAREAGLHLPIDIFLRSLARVQGSRSIAVILSGNASDGSLGVRAVKAECGITFAQDETTARFGGMPCNAIATGAVDYVLHPADIGRELAVIGHHPYLVPTQSGDVQTEVLPEGEAELKRIFALLHATTRVDFSHYKPTTTRRRIGRRMMLLRMESMAEYARYAEQHPAELRDLYRDLLISVTSFFRDPASFEALTQYVMSSLSTRVNGTDTVRVWVPGCATGEEVYSLAIALYEGLRELQPAPQLQLFGTDISDVALERARQGIYPEGISQDVTPERLSRFFVKVDTGFQISKLIRECCIFARHDVTRDPPFSQLDVISCRNVLIYFDTLAQRRVFPVFHYALKPTGVLLLGSAETTGAAADLFTPVDKQHHIYCRGLRTTRVSLQLPLTADPSESPLRTGRQAGNLDLHKRVDRIIQNKYSPDAVLVNSELQILLFRGRTSPYLDPAPGKASLNLLRMAREDLVLPLRRALQRANELNVSTRETLPPVKLERSDEELTLEVTPIAGSSGTERSFLIAFLRRVVAPRPVADVTPEESSTANDHVRTLEQELEATREYLRNLTEEHETNSEELRAANEESRSANEELQSANEELGTTQEELQSANEELTTVNEELQSRNQELGSINSDLKNLLGAVTIAIVMVDPDIRIRRVNTAAEQLFELGPLDIGRPIGQVRGRFEMLWLEERVRSVIESLNTSAEEVRDRNGYWYSVAVRPYRTLDNRIAGAVITFQDIDPLKRGLEAAEGARDYAEGMIETVREPLVVLDADLRVLRATTAFYQTFLTSREETEGRFVYDLGNSQWDLPRLRELLGAALFRSEHFYDFEVRHEFPHIGPRLMRLNARRISRPDAQRMLLLAIEDVTERREIAEIRFQRLFETAKDAIVVIEVETEVIEDVNPYMLKLTGFAREDFVSKKLSEAQPFAHLPEASTFVGATEREEIVRFDDIQLRCRDGRGISVELVGNRYKVGSQVVVQANIRDITSRKQAAGALQESEQRFRMFVESVRDYALFQLDSEGNILTWNAGAERLLGWRESEVIGKSSALLFSEEDIEAGALERELAMARVEGKAAHERWHVRKDGSRFLASGILTQVWGEQRTPLGFAKIMRDITSSREQEQELRRSLEEKSILVREIHHRVKNNLQVIVSLLSLQASYSDDAQVLTAFEETEGRVRAMAHIHERLYAGDNPTAVEFGAYLTDLVRELLALHTTVPDRLALELNAAHLVLNIEQAIPLGLIANELIVNSLKHGLKRGPGRLMIDLHFHDVQQLPQSEDGVPEVMAELSVADSGPGLPNDFDASTLTSMGFRLINLLVRQLRGTLLVGEGPGARISVSFPVRMT
ncbi:MAG: PAS domain S-box protein [Bryobacteraceae bacterium]|nr:PAS domain S-box protein [Bryobacteraceae bacterium]